MSKVYYRVLEYQGARENNPIITKFDNYDLLESKYYAEEFYISKLAEVKDNSEVVLTLEYVYKSDISSINDSGFEVNYPEIDNTIDESPDDWARVEQNMLYIQTGQLIDVPVWTIRLRQLKQKHKFKQKSR